MNYILFLLKKKPIVSGNFAVKDEKGFGASFACKIEDAIIATKSREFFKKTITGYDLKDKFIIKVDGINHKFMHLNLKKEINYKVGLHEINCIGDLGLGFSVQGLTRNDITKILLVQGEEAIPINKEDFIDKLYKSKFFQYFHFNFEMPDTIFEKLPNSLKYEYLQNKEPYQLTDQNVSFLLKNKISFSDKIENYLERSYQDFSISDSVFFDLLSKKQKIEYIQLRQANGLGLTKNVYKWIDKNIKET